MSTIVFDRENATVTLPYPVPLEMRRGVRSLNAEGSPIVSRMHNDDVLLIDAEAAALGITRAAFIRWFAVLAAQELRYARTKERVDITP